MKKARQREDSFASPLQGLRTALPVILAYIPLGFAAGVVGARAGLSPAEVALLSLLVFAGVAQFVFADMVGAGAPPPVIAMTVFLVNFRYFLFSTALIPKIRHLSAGKRAAVGAQLTDEGFALMSLLYRPHWGAGGLIALNVSSYAAWCCGNVAGALAGESEQADSWGADYLLIAMFAALLMLKIAAAKRKSAAAAVLLVAAALSVSGALLSPHPLNMLLAAGIAAAAGMAAGALLFRFNVRAVKRRRQRR